MLDRAYIMDFLKAFDFPEDAADVLEAAYDRIYSSGCGTELEAILACYRQNIQYDFPLLLQRIDAVSEASGVSVYTGQLLLFIYMAPILREAYRQAGHTDEMWHRVTCDIKYKAVECRLIKGVWGIFVGIWFQFMFQLKLFAFGRLQFQPGTMGMACEVDGRKLTPDSPVIFVHIPRTGGRLDAAAKDEAYRQAAAFFRKDFKDGTVIFACESWLLFPRNRQVLKPGSNLLAFFSDFTIVAQEEDEDYSEVWRLFDMDYDGDVSKLPQDSSLRRAYADWIRKGEKMGSGLGVFCMAPAE